MHCWMEDEFARGFVKAHFHRGKQRARFCRFVDSISEQILRDDTTIVRGYECHIRWSNPMSHSVRTASLFWVLRINAVPIVLVKHGYREMNVNAQAFLIETKVVFEVLLNLDRSFSAACAVVDFHLAWPIG